MTDENQSPAEAIFDVANRAARSMIAVVDTITQRGGFKGEELSMA